MDGTTITRPSKTRNEPVILLVGGVSVSVLSAVLTDGLGSETVDDGSPVGAGASGFLPRDRDVGF